MTTDKPEWEKRIRKKYLEEYAPDADEARVAELMGMKDPWFEWWIDVLKEELYQALQQERENQKTLIDWATGDDNGTSSEYLCRYMVGLEPNKTWGKSHPYDQADRGRCIRLLNRNPEWWDRLDELAEVSEGWKEQIPLIRKEYLSQPKEE